MDRGPVLHESWLTGTPFSRPVAEMRLPADLLDAIERFRRADPDVRTWIRHPNVSELVKDTVADCVPLSKRFQAFVAERTTMESYLIRAEAAESPWLTDFHQWTRFVLEGRAINLDWTARQYENLEWPKNPLHLQIPCPLIWISGGASHPVVDFQVQIIQPA